MTSSMDSFSLYDDFPLFSGDLLVGWSPLADELPALAQDELQQNDFTVYISNQGGDDLVKSSQIIEIMEPVQDTVVDKFDQYSLDDSKINLFDLLGQPAESPQMTQLQSTPVNFESAQAEDLLRKVAEMLDIDTTAENFIADNSVECDENESLMELSHSIGVDISTDSGILSGADVDSFLSDNVDEVETILKSGSDNFVANVLSPVSPADIEYILSSSPTSPYGSDIGSPTNSSAYGSDLMSPCSSMDTSFEASSADNSVFEASDNTAITISMKYLKEELLKPTFSHSTSIEEASKSRRMAVSHRSQRRRVKHEPYSPTRGSSRSSYDGNKSESSSSIPSRSGGGDHRKQRKKQQNKDAALRYRTKKKGEKLTVSQECDQLEGRNNKLHDKVDSMTREIQYLKDLLAEVYQAKAASGSKLCK